MAKKSKLLSALDAHKGRNFDLEHQKKLQKAANKRKKEKQLEKTDEEEDDVEQSNEGITLINGKDKSNGEKTTKGQKGMKKVDEKQKQGNSDSEEEDAAASSAENDVDENEDEDEEVDEEEDQEEGEEDIPLSDISGDEAADVILHQRLTINNSAAILSSLKRISFINDQTLFSEHQSLTSTETMDIPDPNDDLNRELAFYKVCASAAKIGRALLKKEGIPFSRPTDYFAEMVKDDEHMDKIKKKMYEEAASKKASADAKKQRDLKKFGKQVQIAKIHERHKEKRETLEKINDLKRKRRGAGNGEAEESELFDVALEESSRSDSRRGPRGKDGEGSHSKRQRKDAKFGFGGKKRFAKSGDAISSGDLSSFSTSKMKGKKTGAAKRLGKGRRQARR